MSETAPPPVTASSATPVRVDTTPAPPLSAQPPVAVQSTATTSPPLPPVSAQPLRVAADIMERYVINHPQPSYPEFARRAKIEGAVTLGVVIGADGAVKRIRVLSGDPEFAAGAVDAVRQWRYRPYVRDGQATEVQTELAFHFKPPK